MILEEELRNQTTAEVRFDSTSRTIYSVDASIYEVTPLGVAIPKTQADLINCIKLAARHGVPIIPRGAATGITGGCLGSGLILDTSKFLTNVISLDLPNKRVKVEPGIIQDKLNAFLQPHGFRLGPDTSTGDRATLGGMAANNAAGARSLHFGTMADAVEEVELVLPTGIKLHFGPLDEKQWNEKLSLSNQEGEIYRTLDRIRKELRQAILDHYPPLPRRASGYNLDRLITSFPLNPAKLIVGSEGSLGVITTLTLSIAPVLKNLELCLFQFKTILEAVECVPLILKENPIALEMIDDKILFAGQSSPSIKGRLHGLTAIPAVLLIAEFQAPHAKAVAARLSQLTTEVISDPKEMQKVWDLRKAGLGLLLSKRSYSRAVAFIEDLSIPPTKLKSFMQQFLSYLKEKGKEAGIYGHVGPGCLHIRPYMDLRNPSEVALLKEMMLDLAKMIQEVGGAMSGEHGDGLIRSWLNETLYGQELLQAFQKIKQSFDPLNLMNPHKIVDGLPVEENLRKYPQKELNTFLSFAEEGGIALSADLCNGNGFCRKEQNVMCPSFQVTHDEYDSTRARANVVRSTMQTGGDLANPELHAILDLCIQCKGCKGECPSQVDMAKMKAEALYHYQEKHGYTLRNRLFAHLDSLSKFSFPMRKLYNHFINSRIGKKLLGFTGVVGPLPPFAEQRFSNLVTAIDQPAGNAVILLNDTYTEFYCPEVGLAAMRVLNYLGFHVTVPPWSCCGRPAISKGFLPHAKSNAEQLVATLQPFGNVPIIGLEPSCLVTLLDEYRALLPPEKLPQNCILFDTFVAKHMPADLPTRSSRIALHGHCHQKALIGMQDTLSILKKIPQLHVTEIPSGCCGMAGSFGHEAEHAKFSQSIGELILLPFVRNLQEDVCVIANGFSCRSQIAHYTERKALHLAQFLDQHVFN